MINNLNFFCSHRLPVAEAALNKGFEVIIGYGEIGDANLEILENKGFKLKHIPFYSGGINPFKEFKTFFYIWNFFKKESPDIIHLVTIKPYLYGGIISRLAGVPALVSAISGLGTIFINTNFKYSFFRLLLYPIYRIAFGHPNQKIIIQNIDDLKLLVDWGVLNPKKTKLIKGSGVNLKKFKNFEEPNGIPIVCFAARLLKDKGINEFVSAAKLLKERGLKAKFYLAGNIDKNNPTGINFNDFEKIKKEGYVKVLGYQKDIPKLYANTHIVCLPSYREGMPKSLIEAAAAGRAVVTTDAPGCRDAIIPNKTGLLVPTKNSKKLADALQWLIEHPQERVSMGINARKFAEKEFSIDIIINQHIDIYQELLKNLCSVKSVK